MAENLNSLSRAVSYGAQLAPRSYMPEQQDFIGQAAKAASEAIAGLQKKKQDKEQQYKETRERIESLNKAGMYQGHYDMLQEAATILKSPAIIDEYTSSPEKQIQYENMVDELNQSIDYYENYYTTTFGKSGDPANGITYSAELSRQLNPSVNAWGEAGMEQVTTNEELTNRLVEVSKGFHTPGSVTIKDGKLVYGTPAESGEPMLRARGTKYNSILNQNLPAQPFQPELRAIEMSGAEYFAKIDNGSFDTKERMSAYMSGDLNRDSAAFQGVARHYINEQKKKNPSYDDSLEELMTNPDKRQDVIKFAIEEADEIRRKPKVVTTTNQMSESQRKEIMDMQNAVNSVFTGARNHQQKILSPIVGPNIPGNFNFNTAIEDRPTFPLASLNLGFIPINGENIKVTSVSFNNDGSITVEGVDKQKNVIEPTNIRPENPAYGQIDALLMDSPLKMGFDELTSPEVLSRIKTVDSTPWKDYL